MSSFVFLSLFSSVLFLNFFQGNGAVVPPILESRANSFEISIGASNELTKRQSFTDARMIYYNDASLGTCGITNVPSDFIVALDSDLYGSGQYCFDTITITYNGTSAQAQITDECPGCPYGGLDLSQGLFEFFAPLSDGVIYADWSFDS